MLLRDLHVVYSVSTIRVVVMYGLQILANPESERSLRCKPERGVSVGLMLIDWRRSNKVVLDHMRLQNLYHPVERTRRSNMRHH